MGPYVNDGRSSRSATGDIFSVAEFRRTERVANTGGRLGRLGYMRSIESLLNTNGLQQYWDNPLMAAALSKEKWKA
jgi:hypothetical protein